MRTCEWLGVGDELWGAHNSKTSPPTSKSMLYKLLVPVVRHHKGGLYARVFPSTYASVDGRVHELVVYKSLNEPCRWWCRPVEMFNQPGRFSVVKDVFHEETINHTGIVVSHTEREGLAFRLVLQNASSAYLAPFLNMEAESKKTSALSAESVSLPHHHHEHVDELVGNAADSSTAESDTVQRGGEPESRGAGTH